MSTTLGNGREYIGTVVFVNVSFHQRYSIQLNKQTNLVTMAISREKNSRVKIRRERSLNHPLIYFLNVCLVQVLLIIQEINFPKRILNVLERGKIRGMKNKLTILTAQENSKSQTSKMKMNRKEKNHKNMAEKTKKTWNFLPGNR